MNSDFQYGRCLPFRATITPEFCRKYKAGGKDKCRDCEGIIMDLNEIKPAAPGLDISVSEARSFSERLKELMAARGVSAKKLSHEINLSNFTVGRWVRGETMPATDQAISLDKYFGSTLAEDFKNELRPPINRKSPGSKEKPPAQANEAEAITDFLKGFGGHSPGGGPAPVDAISGVFNVSGNESYNNDDVEALPEALAGDRRLAIGFLSRVLDCFLLIMKAPEETEAR